MTWRILQGDVLARLAELPDNHVQCVVTSPPYWGLRDYKTEGQLGLEPTPEEYVAKMVTVFREVRRVLRVDGTCWVNMGDGYASGEVGRHDAVEPTANGPTYYSLGIAQGKRQQVRLRSGLKPKDLIGMPWRLAFALQADGWVLRSEIIWAKPNPMPESVTDRPTKAHETVFLFSKAKRVGPEPSALACISDDDARWIALLFDTEGNIVVKRAQMESGRTTYGLQVAFANTSRRLIARAAEIVGAGSVHERPGKNAPMYYWQIANAQAAELMKRIYPFLIVKQRQARLGIHVQSLFATSRTERLSVPGRLRGRTRSDAHTETLERCWATMKQLNHFGNPDISWVPEPAFGRWDSQPYYYDQEAVREPAEFGRKFWAEAAGTLRRAGGDPERSRHGDATWNGCDPSAGRNLRTVWTIPTESFSGAHFATFPRRLVLPCLQAGTSAKGCCAHCGAPWERVVEKSRTFESGSGRSGVPPMGKNGAGLQGGGETLDVRRGPVVHAETTGWRPTCRCPQLYDPPPCKVLDPFCGSGTVGVVAKQLGRDFIGIELSENYCVMARRRIENPEPEPQQEIPDEQLSFWSGSGAPANASDNVDLP